MRTTEENLIEYVISQTRVGDVEGILNAVHEYTRAKTMMHLGEEKGIILDRIVNQVQPKRILELGAYFGYSAVRMGRLPAAREGRLLSVELNKNSVQNSRKFVEHAGLGDIVEFIEGDAADVLETLDGSFDLVYIDHYAQNYLRDLMLVEELGLLAPGGAVVTDNVILHETQMQEYLNYLRDSGRYASQTFATETIHGEKRRDGVELSISKAGVPA